MTKKRIAVLLYEQDDEKTLKNHLISLIAEIWRDDGHEVIFLFGIDEFIPADLLFLHVDLSVVPDSYFEFANQYPVVVNGNIKDIRKSVYSPGLLQKDDDWDGPVIVKSEKNSAGIPERTRAGFFGKVRNKLLRMAHRLNLDESPLTIRTAIDYKVYPHLRKVPRYCFHHPGLIVQKFMPEIDNGNYCIRVMFFLGDHHTCIRIKSKHPIVKDATANDFKRNIKPHPDILTLREKLNFDYGKFDYVEIDGKAILLDANKTVGWLPNLAGDLETKKRIQYHASGLYSFFED